MQEKQRKDNLDLLKAIGILLVITLHVPLWSFDFIAEPSVSHVLQYAMRLLSEGVPIFLMVNGYLLLRKQTFDMHKHLRKMGHLFLLFLLWSVILITVGQLCSDSPDKSFTIGVYLSYIANTQVGSVYTGVLWYLQNLLAVYLIYPILKKIYDDNFRLFRYLFILATIFSIGRATISVLLYALNVFTGINDHGQLLNFIGRFNPVANAEYVYYFMLGGILTKAEEKIREKRTVWMAGGLAAWITASVFGYGISLRTASVFKENWNYNSIFMTVILIGLWAAALPYRNKGGYAGRLIAEIGRDTLGIYLIHFVFIYVLNRYYPAVTGADRWIRYGIVILCSLVFATIARRIPGVRKIVE